MCLTSDEMRENYFRENVWWGKPKPECTFPLTPQQIVTANSVKDEKRVENEIRKVNEELAKYYKGGFIRIKLTIPADLMTAIMDKFRCAGWNVAHVGNSVYEFSPSGQLKGD